MNQTEQDRRVDYIEFPTTDIEATKRFYSEIFGWKFQDMPMPAGTYSLFETGEGGLGGGIWNPPEGMPRQTINYLAVDDLDAVLEMGELRRWATELGLTSLLDRVFVEAGLD